MISETRSPEIKHIGPPILLEEFFRHENISLLGQEYPQMEYLFQKRPNNCQTKTKSYHLVEFCQAD
jgi:hypothetical protein